jgi:hypothetical protein
VNGRRSFDKNRAESSDEVFDAVAAGLKAGPGAISAILIADLGSPA